MTREKKKNQTEPRLHYNSGKEVTLAATGKKREETSICGEATEPWSLVSFTQVISFDRLVSWPSQSQQSTGHQGKDMIKIGKKLPLPPFLSPLGL